MISLDLKRRNQFLGRISCLLRQTPSSLSPSANSVGIGRSTIDTSLFWAVVFEVSLRLLLLIQSMSALRFLTHLVNRYSLTEVKTMIYKQWVLNIKQEWNGITVDYFDPEGNCYSEPFCFPTPNEAVSYGRLRVDQLIRSKSKSCTQVCV